MVIHRSLVLLFFFVSRFQSPLQIPIGISFTPTTEPPGTPNAFMQDCPRNMLNRLRETPQNIPYIIGYNTMEGQIFSKIAREYSFALEIQGFNIISLWALIFLNFMSNNQSQWLMA